ESVSLVCSYDLGNEELYVVKWYKDELEFYRFEPKDNNQSVYFPQPGIDLDLSRSGNDSVYLKNVALESAGEYKCQVSTEAPTYSCVQAVKEMDVIVLPQEGPQISGGEGSYNFGDNVTLFCTSAKSKPAATLRWRVNDRLVDDNKTIDHGVTLYKDNLEVTSKTISLSVVKELLSNGKVTIKCEASLYDRFTMNSKDVTILDINGASLCITRWMLMMIMSVLINFTLGLR
ncbi:unnamed protein product, partial [Larinioides sclopetarius]